MAQTNSQILVPDETILNKIFLIRGHKVMIDSNLAELYQVETKRINEQVKRNQERFPEDFMTNTEWLNLKSHSATSSWGGRRTPPNVFTEHGVLMLSSVLNNSRAIQVNILIMRAYIKMREMIVTSKDILLKLEQLERKSAKSDQHIAVLFKYLRQLRGDESKQKRRMIGFKNGELE